jgi:hypothetical protein
VTDYICTLEGMTQAETIEFPYIIIMNLLRPEKNWGFEISEIECIKFRDYTQDGFHIRKTTTPPQADNWEATIPCQRYPNLESRAVQIRGPSQDYWHQDPTLYHEELFMQEDTTKPPKDCPSTLNAHKNSIPQSKAIQLVSIPTGCLFLSAKKKLFKNKTAKS